MDKGVLFAHLNVHGQIGVVHIRAYIREQVGQLAADVLADLGRGHGELFVPALGFHLEGLCLRKARRKIGLRGRDHAFERLFRADCRARDGRKAEHMARAVHHGVRICVLRHFDIHDRLAHRDLAVRHMLHAAGQVLEQTVLKGFAVKPLEHNLPTFEQQYFFHGVSFYRLNNFTPFCAAAINASISSLVLAGQNDTRSALSVRALGRPSALSTPLCLPLEQADPLET